MWVQLDGEQIHRLVRLARSADLADVAEKLQHYLDLEAEEGWSLAPYRQAAQELYGKESELEFDQDAVVSGGIGNGAYVMGWRWVDDCDLERSGNRPDVKLEC